VLAFRIPDLRLTGPLRAFARLPNHCSSIDASLFVIDAPDVQATCLVRMLTTADAQSTMA
jgi:hypothetical protein